MLSRFEFIVWLVSCVGLFGKGDFGVLFILLESFVVFCNYCCYVVVFVDFDGVELWFVVLSVVFCFVYGNVDYYVVV